MRRGFALGFWSLPSGCRMRGLPGRAWNVSGSATRWLVLETGVADRDVFVATVLPDASGVAGRRAAVARGLDRRRRRACWSSSSVVVVVGRSGGRRCRGRRRDGAVPERGVVGVLVVAGGTVGLVPTGTVPASATTPKSTVQ